MASAAIAAAVALGGCQTDGLQSTKHLKELSPEMLAELQKKSMPKESPILVRLFKQESELEVWKQDGTGRYALLKTYPMCRWSGDLGPKIKEGDRQAPEGFYNVTPAQMNPNSQYFLSFNMGYPNAYDRAWGRTGAHLMVHGDCSSRGCYAMTNDQIGEIYALGRESFFGGQKSFQVQAYPFRMTAANFAKHRNNPNLPFWKMLKEGNDHFEVTALEPKVDVCEKRYVFNAEPPANATPVNFSRVPATPALRFNSTAKCPVYQVPEDVAAEVAAKKQRDEVEIASLVSRGAKAAPVRNYVDGGMHPTFLAKLKPREVRETDGTVRYVVDESAARRLGSYVNPPLEQVPAEPEITAAVATATPAARRKDTPSAPANAYMLAGSQAKPAPQARPQTQVASTVASTQPRQEGMFGRVTNTVGRLFDFGQEKPNPVAAPAPAPKPAKATLKPAPGAILAAKPRPEQRPEPRPEARPAPQAQPPRDAAPAQAYQQQPARPAAAAGLLNGAQPVVPTGSFENRWGALR